MTYKPQHSAYCRIISPEGKRIGRVALVTFDNANVDKERVQKLVQDVAKALGRTLTNREGE